MKTVQGLYPKLNRVLKETLVVSAIAAALMFPKNVWAAAGNNQICVTQESCTIGEFLYDDSYDPLTSATCSITSRYPNGTSHLSSVSMPVSGEGDGWYAYTFTAPATLGLYRTEVRCTVGSDVMALDKSFEVTEEASGGSSPSADDIAEATWGYSDRTLSSFGSLISDIWSAATRTLTGAGLTSGSIATKADVDSVSSKADTISGNVDDVESAVSSLSTKVDSVQTQSVNALEKLVNGPIVEHLLEDGEASENIETKIEDTKSSAALLTVKTNYLKSKAALISSKWDSYKIDQLVTALTSLKGVVGNKGDKDKKTIIGTGTFIQSKWGWKEADKVVLEAASINISLTSIIKDLDKNGKTKATHDKLTKLIASTVRLEKAVGNVKSNSTEVNLYTRIKKTEALASTFNSANRDITKLLISWNPDTQKLEKTVDTITDGIMTINQLPKIGRALVPAKISSDADRNLKNRVLGILGVIKANREYLASDSSNAFASTWLELGSIVFKTIISNPSSTVKQTVPLRYDLPPEIQREHVLQVDDGLEIKFDSEKNNYYISGIFELDVNESKTLSVVADDKVFDILEVEIASLKKQAEDLAKPLEGTSYFAQGVTLKSDIEVSLDRVLALKASASTPETKIKNYREAQIELKAVKLKIEQLKEIVTSAGSVGTLFGFVGGAQALSVWGLIVIIIAGFVFLALYMRMLRNQELKSQAQLNEPLNAEVSKAQDKKKAVKVEEPEPLIEEGKQKPRYRRAVRIGVVLVSILTLGSFAVAGITLYKKSSNQIQNAPQVAVQVDEKSSDKEVLGAKSAKDEEVVKEQIRIFVPEDSSVSIHKDASLDSSELIMLTESTTASKLEATSAFVKVSIDHDGEEIIGWVDADFIQDELDTEELVEEEDRLVIVPEDLTGFLKVRELPITGDVVGKIKAGDEFALLEEKKGWVKIQLEDGIFGWVSSDYVTISSSE